MARKKKQEGPEVEQVLGRLLSRMLDVLRSIRGEVAWIERRVWQLNAAGRLAGETNAPKLLEGAGRRAGGAKGSVPAPKRGKRR